MTDDAGVNEQPIPIVTRARLAAALSSSVDQSSTNTASTLAGGASRTGG